MKKLTAQGLKLTAPLALTAILLTGCTSDTEADTEPTPSETPAEETPTASPTGRKQLSDYDEDERNFLADLADIRSTLTNEELVEAGHRTCEDIERNKSADTVTGSNISDATFYYMLDFENDPDNGNEVVRAAVYNFCPELVDQFDYEAMRSGPFFDDFTEEREALHDD